MLTILDTTLTPVELKIVAIAFLGCVAAMIYVRFTYPRVKKETRPIYVATVLWREYQTLLDRIRNAATPTELACLQDQVLDFKLDFQSRTNDVEEYFTELMSQIHVRSVRLRWLDRKQMVG
jgi:hypothetical protein